MGWEWGRVGWEWGKMRQEEISCCKCEKWKNLVRCVWSRSGIREGRVLNCLVREGSKAGRNQETSWPEKKR